jgi:hypothetical protein
MPYICSVCTKNYYSYQSCLQCDRRKSWIHHGNKLSCSGLSDAEFVEHQVDEYKPFECDNCIMEHNAKVNNSVFGTLPFPVESDDNPFGKPPEPKRKSDISSMTPSQLKKFIEQCELIESQLSDNTIESDELIPSLVNSNYYDIKKFNSLKPDRKSAFGLLHLNIASLNKHIDDLRTTLNRLKFNFDVIGISEHKIGKDTNDIEIKFKSIQGCP